MVWLKRDCTSRRRPAPRHDREHVRGANPLEDLIRRRDELLDRVEAKNWNIEQTRLESRELDQIDDALIQHSKRTSGTLCAGG